MAQRASIPKGTRDFSSQEVLRRNYIIDIIKKQFSLYGFNPIETPSFENSDTLLGKYGEEGDRLIFKILNNGSYLKKVNQQDLDQRNESNVTSVISDRALKYDLTVPFARYVVQHKNDIAFPFKRYQIQNVWRADRPQRGRFREFTQCDADVIGSDSLLQEAGFITLYDRVFESLGLKNCTINLNNRKILAGMAQVMGASDKLIDFTVALDKLDKIGEERVKEEMKSKGITGEAIEKLQPIFTISGDFNEKLDQLKEILKDSAIGLQGINELETVYDLCKNAVSATAINLNITLARGLNYYTGCIIEVSAPDSVTMGSIGGGGRYDDLTGIFGLKDMSGVGISFGLDRIYLCMEQLDLFPKNLKSRVDVLFLNFGEEESKQVFMMLSRFRESGITCELYPDTSKIKKQMSYADKTECRYVMMIGENEIASGKYKLKNMTSGDEITDTIDNLIAILQ